jgi:hypothetical protein
MACSADVIGHSMREHKAKGVRSVVGVQDDDWLDPFDLEARSAEQQLEAAWQVIVGEVRLPGRCHTRAEARIVGVPDQRLPVRIDECEAAAGAQHAIGLRHRPRHVWHVLEDLRRTNEGENAIRKRQRPPAGRADRASPRGRRAARSW